MVLCVEEGQNYEHPIVSLGFQKGSRLNCINSFVIINRYGHPHKETLETLERANSKVYRTDECGCIIVKVRKRITVDEFGK